MYTMFFYIFLLIQAEVNPSDQAAAEMSEAAWSELMDRCEDQFAQLEKVKSCPFITSHWMWKDCTNCRLYRLCVSVLQLQNEIILSEPDFCENPTEQVRWCSVSLQYPHNDVSRKTSVPLYMLFELSWLHKIIFYVWHLNKWFG